MEKFSFGNFVDRSELLRLGHCNRNTQVLKARYFVKAL